MELSLKEVEVSKINLQPGEVLVVTVKAEDMDESSMDYLAQGFRKYFPNNKIAVLALGENDEIKFQTVKGAPDLSCAASPVGYCSDCSCGKREQIEGENK